MTRPFATTAAGDPARADAELLACVLYWGIDRRIPVDRIAGVLAGLPEWLQRAHRDRGSGDPMIQSLILEHLRVRGGR